MIQIWYKCKENETKRNSVVSGRWAKFPLKLTAVSEKGDSWKFGIDNHSISNRLDRYHQQRWVRIFSITTYIYWFATYWFRAPILPAKQASTQTLGKRQATLLFASVCTRITDASCTKRCSLWHSFTYQLLSGLAHSENYRHHQPVGSADV